MSIRRIVFQMRETLAQGRQRAERSHHCGTPGRQVANQLADLYDDVVSGVWSDLTGPLADRRELGGISLVAHGGFGRRDLSPYSDADLMLLTRRRSEALAETIVRDLTRDLGDIGLDPGLSIRTAKDACQLAWSDPVVFTSLTESRLLAGSLETYRNYFNRFRQGSIRRRRRLIPGVIAARLQERRKWGESSYTLQPNVKRSRGTLRDIQLIRWIGFANWGETDLERLVLNGLLPDEDYHSVRRFYNFLLRVRHELHFRAGQANDVLDRQTQMAIAKDWGYEGSDGTLAVEAFMREFFAGVRDVRFAAAYCAEEALPRSQWSRLTESLTSKRISAEIRVSRRHLWVSPKTVDQLAASLPDVLRLMTLSSRLDRRIAHRTWRAIRLAMKGCVDDQTLGDEAIDAWIELLGESSRLADLLRRLHDLRIIEKLIPEFKQLRGMLQFNAYHQYPVDTHSIRAVEAATQFADQPNGWGRRYGRIENKALLHLTLLIHDIGKGHAEDHCIVGERIAWQVADRLKLSPEDSETMAWLVRNHLIVNVAAFRHDLSDPKIVLDFAKEVGSIRRLEMLVVHTVADLIAVGPDVASDWKLNLIEDLYRRTRRYFDSGALPGSPDDPEIEGRRRAVIESLEKDDASESLAGMVGDLPLSLLSRHPPEFLANAIRSVAEMPASKTTHCVGESDGVGGVHYLILRREEPSAIGTFARAASALTSLGQTVRRAQVERFGELTWEDFWVDDTRFPATSGGEATLANVQRAGTAKDAGVSQQDDVVPDYHIRKMCNRLTRYLDDFDLPIPPPQRLWNTRRRSASVNVLPEKVVFDNDTVDKHTILSLFAYDSPGLLARVCNAIADQQLVLSFAKIDTHLDQVADVFYVNEKDNSLLTEPHRQAEVREAILSAIRPEKTPAGV
ncbi:MAG: HD domain-containing protein [Planctomycetota bacterium]